MDERRSSDGRRERLEKKVTDLAVGVVGMKGAMEGLSKALQHEVDDLKEQLERQRRLTKYARRTWFEMMAWIFLIGLLVSDVGRRYCTADVEPVSDFAARTCDVVFWTTDHGGGGWWRVLGFCLMAGLLYWMGRRSQVPGDLFDDIPAAQSRLERAWFRRRRN